MLPIWDAATGCYGLPPALGATGSFGGLGRSPAQREGVLQRDVYGKMAVAGAVGCAITHLVRRPASLSLKDPRFGVASLPPPPCSSSPFLCPFL
eukprot:scaffold22716_cov62-Isochrysis_galbana.AAC.1